MSDTLLVLSGKEIMKLAMKKVEFQDIVAAVENKVGMKLTPVLTAIIPSSLAGTAAWFCELADEKGGITPDMVVEFSALKNVPKECCEYVRDKASVELISIAMLDPRNCLNEQFVSAAAATGVLAMNITYRRMLDVMVEAFADKVVK